MEATLLKLISALQSSAPSTALAPRLGRLFGELRRAEDDVAASRTEEQIWEAWMEHDDPGATRSLDDATRSLATGDLTRAEALLDALIEAHPEFAEAWNKRATLRFMQKRDSQSVADITRTLSLEPRHFGALCGFGQICLRRGDHDAALFAFAEALRINPHLNAVREAYDALLADDGTTRH